MSTPERKERPIYLDYAATTPVLPEVAAVVQHYMLVEFGNASSRTHEYGLAAKKAVEESREVIAKAVGAKPDEVTFTSGATEANNIAILGLRAWAEETGRKHIVTTAIEHSAVLEPCEHLRSWGFEITYVMPNGDGLVPAEAVLAAVRPDTALVSVMHVNNETGVIQPIREIADGLGDHPAWFHTDSAQGFGKVTSDLIHPRIEMISISGHKIGAPKGVGALITRRRGYKRPPLQPLMFGGGQERGLRPGTLAVPLIAAIPAAMRHASESASSFVGEMTETYVPEFVNDRAWLEVGAKVRRVPGIRLFVSQTVDHEAIVIALRDNFAISNGAACSTKYSVSHVLEAMSQAMGFEAMGALRISAWPWTTKNQIQAESILNKILISVF
jgi:cysteine desulfurase